MVPPPRIEILHNLPNKPLRSRPICIILKTKEIICKIFKTLELWFLWSYWGDTSLRLVDSVSYVRPDRIGWRALKDVIWITSH
jgi:hypothetical protein